MFLGLIVTILIAVLAFIAVARAVKSFLRALTCKRRVTDKKKDLKVSKVKTTDEAEAHEEEVKEDISQEIKEHYDAASSEGIGEDFWNEDTAFRIDGKAIADSCVGDSTLTYLEYNNRELTGVDFRGFNLIVEEDSRMVLTYGGSAVATLTRTERTCTAIINGETVTGTMPAYRTNTFPPELRPGITLSEIQTAIEASRAIRECGGNPEEVSRTMIGFFTSQDNLTILKREIDRKIQAKESLSKGPRNQKTQRAPRRI